MHPRQAGEHLSVPADSGYW